MQFVLAASDADASAQEPESPSDALSSDTAKATLNLTTVFVLFVGVATLLLLRPERMRTGIAIAAVAAIAALLLPPVPIPIELDPRAAYDVASDIDLGTVNLTAALSLGHLCRHVPVPVFDHAELPLRGPLRTVSRFPELAMQCRSRDTRR